MRKEQILTIGSLFLTLCVVWPIFNGDGEAFAMKADMVTFKEILKPKVSTDNFSKNYDKATEKVQEKLEELNLGYDLNVEEIAAGNLESVAKLELSPMEQMNLTNLILTTHDTVFQGYNSATHMATETAYINQIANGSMGDSNQDLLTTMKSTTNIVNSINQQMSLLNDAQKIIDMALGAKTAFLTEKYDYPSDALTICNNHMPGDQTPIFPELFAGIDFKVDFPEFDHEDIFERVKSSANLDGFMEKQFQNLSNPDFVNVFKRGDLKPFMESQSGALNLAQQASIATEEAEDLLIQNRNAETFEKSAQALEMHGQEMKEQYDNYKVQTTENFSEEVLNNAILNAVEQAKGPTT